MQVTYIPGSTVIPFGMHLGKKWAEVPRHYKLWVLSRDVFKTKAPELHTALLQDVVDMLTAELNDNELC